MDPSITVFDYKHERVTEGIVQEIRVKDLDVGNGVGTVAFMSEDSVTEFHGSHEWAQGRKFLKLQFSCRGRRGKLTEVIFENTFLDSFRSIFPNRGHYVYLVNKAQPLQGWEHVIKEDSVPSEDSGCPCRQGPAARQLLVQQTPCRPKGEHVPSEDSEEEEDVRIVQQIVQDVSVRRAVERAVEREFAPIVQKVVQDLSRTQQPPARKPPPLVNTYGVGNTYEQEARSRPRPAAGARWLRKGTRQAASASSSKA